jgi:alkyldihydroxyacetonephosphate synthase
MRKHWGWGTVDRALSAEQLAAAAPGIVDHLGFGRTDPEEPVPLERADMPPPRLRGLEGLARSDAHTRACHALGKSYTDVVRGFRGDFASAPDLVAYPRNEAELADVLAWCEQQGAAAIPYGGGTSVVGGVEPRGLESYNGVVSLDLSGMDRVLEVDPVSRSALVQAGAAGPRLQEQLRPQGLTSRFFPQSFEFSTVGGWIATRAGGHYASGPTHIDDVVESVRALTPRGVWESRRLPASGAGPSPDRLLLGSEGTLGVITQAWLRVMAEPVFKVSAALRFPDFQAGCDAIREILQAGLSPSNCRLIEGAEAPGEDQRPLLILGVEGGVDMSGALDAAVALGTRHGGQRQDGGGDAAWRDSFLQAPYLRDTLVSLGILAETFETAVTWERLPGLIAAVRAACPFRVTCRLTHVYPDGAAPYFTVLAPVQRGAEIEAWQAVKEQVSDALLSAGGTITHHHAVGRDHVPWYTAQRPAPFGEVLRAAKATTDPRGILNPGVLGL